MGHFPPPLLLFSLSLSLFLFLVSSSSPRTYRKKTLSSKPDLLPCFGLLPSLCSSALGFVQGDSDPMNMRFLPDILCPIGKSLLLIGSHLAPFPLVSKFSWAPRRAHNVFLTRLLSELMSDLETDKVRWQGKMLLSHLSPSF